MRDRPLTIGVMARAPVPGRCKTRLTPRFGQEGAATLYRAMLLDTLEGVDQIAPDRRVVLAAPEDDGERLLSALVPSTWEVHPQRGHDLGARLRNAFTDLHLDDSLVCLVGSDSPAVRWSELAAPLRVPRPARVILAGPCDDGGYYLIGMTSLELGILEGIPWSTPSVMAVTRARCSELETTLEELPCSWDIDDPDDVDRLRAELERRPDAAPRTQHILSLLERAR